jgi:hypothetical protein
MPFILDTFKDRAGHTRAIVVDDTLYCGVCKPKDEAVTLADLE